MTDTTGPDTPPMLPEVVRFWPTLLDGAAFIMDDTTGGNLFDKLPSNMKRADWQSFAIAAAFLVADLADRAGATPEDLTEKAAELRRKATEGVPTT